MVHIVFDTGSIGFDEFVQIPQIGTGVGGITGEETELNFFRGSPPYQRGYGIQGGAGIGDVLRGIWRFFLPILRRVGTEVGSEALQTGQRVFDRITNEGAPLKQTLISEGRRGIDTVLEKGGLPKQFGSGGIKGQRRYRKRLTIPTHQTLIGGIVKKLPPKKRQRSDIFGLY